MLTQRHRWDSNQSKDWFNSETGRSADLDNTDRNKDRVGLYQDFDPNAESLVGKEMK